MIFNILFSLIAPLVSSLTNIFIIPHILNVNAFGDWRFILTILSFSGLLHLGYADGLYKSWIEDGIYKHKIYIVPFAVSTIFSCSIVSLLYLFISREISASIIIFLGTFVIATSSFGSYYILFLKNNTLRYILPSQSIIMLLGILIIYLLDSVSVANISMAFIFSYLPYLVVIRKVIDYSNDYLSWKKYLKSGLPLLMANLTLVAFMNIDKIFVRFISEDNKMYAGYSLGSSIFVIACSVGLTVGNLMLSKRKSFFESKRSRFLVNFTTVIITPISILLSAFINKILPKYEFNYTYFFILSIFAFSFCVLYFSYGRIFLTRKVITVMSYFAPYFIICLYFFKMLGLNIYMAGPLVILAFIILSALIIEAYIQKSSADRSTL